MQNGLHQLGVSSLRLDKLRCVFSDALEMQECDSLKRDSSECLDFTEYMIIKASKGKVSPLWHSPPLQLFLRFVLKRNKIASLCA